MKKLEIGSRIVIGKKVEVEAEVLLIGNKIKIQRVDKEKPTYIYEKDIIRIIEVIVEKVTTKKEVTTSKKPKYIDYILNYLENENVATITSLIKRLPSLNSATGYIRPSQLSSSIKYLIDNNSIIKVEKEYKLI